ncbi:MAG: hypothetical protein ABI896_06845 [Actinomycetota bacterium]
MIAGIAVAFAAVLVILSGAWFAVQGEAVMNDCASTPSGVAEHQRAAGITGVSTDFTFVPPGWDCVYWSRNGREVARRRADSP